MYVALTMITQNVLSRKQHISRNRKGSIILGFDWKPYSVTLYPTGSQLSSGWALGFVFIYVIHAEREKKREAGKR
jgi:hypothetical protein